MATCPNVTTGAFLSTLLQHIDCQGQSIGGAGYQALADPGSPVSLVLTSLLTIFIALFGLRMALGETPSLRDGVLAVVKIGVVLLIATSWPAYRTVVYDVIVRGPAQLSAAIASPSRLPGMRGDLVSHLQVSDNAITRLTTLGSGRNDLTSTPKTGADGRAAPVERAPLADDLALGSARVLFLSSVVAAFTVVRLGAGILLALAPLFAGLLLFDIARGLFVGWVRALVFTLLSSVAVTVITGVQLAILEPWLAQTLRLRHARIITPDAPIELLVLCLAFAIALAGALALILRLSFMLDPRLLASSRPSVQAAAELATTKMGMASTQGPTNRLARAADISGAVAAAQRREVAARPVAPAVRGAHSFAVFGASGRGGSGATHSLAQSTGPWRRRRPRTSKASALRDKTS